MTLPIAPYPKPSAHPRLDPVPGPVTLHLLDPENFLEGSVTSARLLAFRRTYERTVGIGASDRVIAGFCPQTERFARRSLDRPFELVTGVSGPDSAETAVIASVNPAAVVRNFDRVVIGSGDGAFTDLALALRELDVSVVVVALRQVIASTLWRACSDHLLLDMPRAA